MGDRILEPGSVSGALAMLHRALDYLTAVDIPSLPTGTQAGALEAAEAKQTAARAAVLAAFTAGGGPQADGHGSPRVARSAGADKMCP